MITVIKKDTKIVIIIKIVIAIIIAIIIIELKALVQAANSYENVILFGAHSFPSTDVSKPLKWTRRCASNIWVSGASQQ